ncbi:hypothetical protein [Solidesulfovibrio alcoholivorans]|uniref:hypothetical protein n=1 Tax=Solidesulfovibrio alcoholivorans TaxID=81406 RepID=UPI0004953C86|nr:hypothetical protein [Solidesulfovibrio alcoholivorans]
MSGSTVAATVTQTTVLRKGRLSNLLCACLFSVAVFFLLYSRDYYISTQYAVLIALLLAVLPFLAAARAGDDRPYFRLGLAGICLAVLLACLPLAHGTWAVADDYIIPMMLDEAGRMDFGDLIAHLGVSQSFGVIFDNTSGRFQPLFVFMYAVNTFVFGDHIQLWYMLYGALFLASVALTLLALRRCFDGVTAVLAGCVIYAHLHWYWLFRDTGVVEVYGLLGLSLSTWVIARNRSRAVVSMRACLLATLGGFLMIGTKETFAPAALLPLGFFFCRAFSHDARERRKAVAFGVVNLALCLYVLVGIVAALAALGADASGGLAGYAALLRDLATYLGDFGRRIAWPWYAGSLAVLACANLLPFRGRAPAAAAVRGTWISLGLIAFMLLFALSQYVFYQGDIDNQHYSIPLTAIPALLWLTAGRLFLQAASRLGSPRADIAARMLLVFLCCSNVLATPSFAKDLIRILCEKNATYVASLERVAKAVSKEPDRPLILVVGDTQNEELAVSPAVYLKEIFDIPNAVYVRPTTAAASLELLRDKGYGRFITPGAPPADVPAFTVGILTTPEAGAGDLGRLLPVPAGEPQFKLLPFLSRNIW